MNFLLLASGDAAREVRVANSTGAKDTGWDGHLLNT